MQTHLYADLNVGRGSIAYWSLHPRNTAIIFVHGFGGKATGTWLEFPGMLQLEPLARNVDLIFFGYDGLRTRATNTAVMLEQFLNRLFTNANSVVNGTLPHEWHRKAGFTYERIVLVAHSLGAVVTRQALLDAHLRNRPWGQKTRMVLFAPAHCGSNLLRLVSSAAAGISIELPGFSVNGETAASALKIKLRVLQDLDEDCQTLRKLLDDTVAAIAPGGANYLVPRRVFHAEFDDVVNPVRFAQDPPHDLLLGKDHMEICKPNGAFQDPITAVLGEV